MVEQPPERLMPRIITKRATREEILALSVPLFARHGYEGVSMRDVAAAVALTPAALYYHFADKEQLYLDAVAHEFRDKAGELVDVLTGPRPPWTKLEAFVASLARMLSTHKDFLRLMQWVLLDGDELRQHTLARHVFKDLLVAVHELAADLDARQVAHLLAISILATVFFPFQVGVTRRFMPGHRAEQDDPAVLARHVIGLLRIGLNPAGQLTGDDARKLAPGRKAQDASRRRLRGKDD